MSTTASPPKKVFRKRRLFPRSLKEAVTDATKPLMDKQGKIYSALLRDWVRIVGEKRAAVSKPDRLQFSPTGDNTAVLHLKVRPAAAPELTYATEQMLEQCARYFGYRAITRMVLHPAHELVPADDAAITALQATARASGSAPTSAITSAMLSTDVPPEMRGVFERLAQHIASASDKKDETR
jgi:hypothetical protein